MFALLPQGGGHGDSPRPWGVLPAWQDLASVPRHECFRALLIPGSKPSWDPASESEPSAPSTQALRRLCCRMSCGDRGASLLSFPRVQTSGLSFCSFSSQPSPCFCLFSTSYYEVLQTNRPQENRSLDTPSPSPDFLCPPSPPAGCVRLITHVSPLCSVPPASGALLSSPLCLSFGIALSPSTCLSASGMDCGHPCSTCVHGQACSLTRQTRPVLLACAQLPLRVCRAALHHFG